MIGFQKVIKYGAMAFAVALIFGILSTIVYGVDSVFSIFDSGSNGIKNMKVIDVSDNVSVLDINIDKVDLRIEKATEFKLEISDEEYISYKEVDERLVIKENKINFFDEASEVIVYVPNGKVFNSIFIETGAGSVEIDSISASKLDLELGMGRFVVNELNISSKTDIDTGVGEFVVSSGTLNNLDLDMGVGNVSITSKVLGKSEIDSGVGRLEVNLVGSIDDYKIGIDKGLGTINVDGVSLGDGGSYGNGSNYIDINGGVGEVNIKIEN